MRPFPPRGLHPKEEETMTTIITTPSGKEIRIDGTRVCIDSSPEKCWEEDPEIIQMRISHARRNYDKGYRVEGSKVFWQRNIVRHRFDTEHPEYEDFRERFLPAASKAGDYYDWLSTKLDLEDREATPEESAEYKEHENKVNALIEEAKSKGIIKFCPSFSMPDVEGVKFLALRKLSSSQRRGA